MGAVGFVLAGGRSARMGRDKALLPWGDGDLLDHALTRLRACCDDVRVLCGPEPRYLERGVPSELDAAHNVGAVAGLLTALERAAGRPALVLAVDLPHVTVPLLEALVARLPAHDAVVPASPRGPEPACAVYGPGCLAPLRQRMAGGQLSLQSFWPDVRVARLEGAALARFGDPQRLFDNVNTPGDYITACGTRSE